MMGQGYCLDFSDRTFSNFFADMLNVNIDDERYFEAGGSKGKRMRHFLRTEPDHIVARLLRGLWEYRVDMQMRSGTQDDPQGLESRYGRIVDRLGLAPAVATDAIDRFTADPTLDELVASIQRDIEAGSPETALDRLHTYCMKKFAHLLKLRNPAANPASTLNARVGQYLSNARKGAKSLHPISFKIMTSSVEVFELFNNVRNDHSFAHDNNLIDKAEARYIFDAIVNFLRFVRTTEGQSFGA